MCLRCRLGSSNSFTTGELHINNCALAPYVADPELELMLCDSQVF